LAAPTHFKKNKPTQNSQIERSLELLADGRPAQAANLLRRLLDRPSAPPDAYHLLAVAVFQMGQSALAAHYAEQAVQAMPGEPDYHSNLGRYYLSLNRLDEAERELRQAIALAPHHAMARHNLATVLTVQRNRGEALEHALCYAEQAPDDPAGQHLVGTLLSELGQPADAAVWLARAVEMNPVPESYNNYGNVLQSLGRAADAVVQYEQALRLREDYPEAASNMGAALQALGHMTDARQWFEQALKLRPGFAQARVNLASLEAASAKPEQAIALYKELLVETPAAETWNNLGNLYQDLGRYAEARDAYAQALQLNPAYFAVHNNQGNLLRRQGKLEEAVASFDRALAHQPNFAEAWNNRGVALADLGHLAEAQSCYQRARQCRDSYPDPWINEGNLARDAGQASRAAECYHQAAQRDPANSYAWNNLGCALGDKNDIPQAIACFERAVDLLPDNHQAFSNILLNLHYLDEPSPGQIHAAHVEFGELYDGLGASLRRAHTNRPDPERPLRVGYVSADFRRHSVAFFLEPVIEGHGAGGQVEAYCYADVARPDEWTRRFAQLAGSRWRDIRGYSRERFAEQVRADAIDILVDTGGHTSNARLVDFTARPAPVQVTWLGYPDTTGLPSMGYRITDAVADPLGTAGELHTEQLVRLPGGFLCFRPPQGSPKPMAAPSLAGAPFTFGSFNNLSKVSPGTLAAWARILQAAPGARLALKNRSFNDTAAQVRTLQALQQLGIPPERVLVSGHMDSLDEHLAAYGWVDVALDTLPYHGTTTTCEALWMGVPVVTLAGQTHAARVGASLLESVGLSQCVAHSVDQYVNLAAGLAADRALLAAVRSGLRERMEHSALRDEAGFARKLETAYRQLWRNWCAQEAPGAQPGAALPSGLMEVGG
jgi:protein O-GlcNAc transferase